MIFQLFDHVLVFSITMLVYVFSLTGHICGTSVIRYPGQIPVDATSGPPIPKDDLR